MLRRLAPFAGATLLGLGLGLIGSRVDLLELGVSVVMTVVLFSVAVMAPWRQVPSWTRVLPAFVYLVAIGILRDAAGGAGSGLSSLMLLPVFWVALYGTRAQLIGVLVASAAVLYVALRRPRRARLSRQLCGVAVGCLWSWGPSSVSACKG